MMTEEDGKSLDVALSYSVFTDRRIHGVYMEQVLKIMYMYLKDG